MPTSGLIGVCGCFGRYCTVALIVQLMKNAPWENVGSNRQGDLAETTTCQPLLVERGERSPHSFARARDCWKLMHRQRPRGVLLVAPLLANRHGRAVQQLPALWRHQASQRATPPNDDAPAHEHAVNDTSQSLCRTLLGAPVCSCSSALCIGLTNALKQRAYSIGKASCGGVDERMQGGDLLHPR